MLEDWKYTINLMDYLYSQELRNCSRFLFFDVQIQRLFCSSEETTGGCLINLSLPSTFWAFIHHESGILALLSCIFATFDI